VIAIGFEMAASRQFDDPAADARSGTHAHGAAPNVWRWSSCAGTLGCHGAAFPRVVRLIQWWFRIRLV